MGFSKDVFIKMREEEYNNIPKEFRERYLCSKIHSVETNDFDLNMQDSTFKSLYEAKKKASKVFEEYQYQLREKRRRNNNK